MTKQEMESGGVTGGNPEEEYNKQTEKQDRAYGRNKLRRSNVRPLRQYKTYQPYNFLQHMCSVYTIIWWI